jgi:hypothetical protein
LSNDYEHSLRNRDSGGTRVLIGLSTQAECILF